MSQAAPGGPDAAAWTIARLVAWTQGYFADKGMASPRLDAELLLCKVLDVDRLYLYTHYDQPLTQEERDRFRALVRRRGKYEPVAYLCGRREFYGRDFLVTPAVLVPRPETEHIIEAALIWLSERSLTAPRILDVGTGSGALAVTLAAELPDAAVVATDVSAEALAVAARNAQAYEVDDRVRLLCGDLFGALDAGEAPFDLIVSNPPYVETVARATLAPDVRDYEPAVALFAGVDGLDVLRPLCRQVHRFLHEPGLFLCEMGAAQQEAVLAALAAAAPWQELDVLLDLAGLPRVARACRLPPI